MTLGGANVWSNFSYGSLIDTPNGWILNPQASYLILFERCKNHQEKISKSIPIFSMPMKWENQDDLKTQDFMISTLPLKYGVNY